MSLAQRQRELQQHVLHGERAIESHIVSDAIPTTTRLGVYIDAYRLRLIETLESNYPVLAELLGADPFAALAQAYIDTHPSRHFSIRWFGHCLAEFLSGARAEQPWLAELARWEWATAHAFDAADATLLTTDDLATLRPDAWAELPLHAHPSLTRLQLNSNTVAIVKASVAEEPLPMPTQAERTEWCIWREDLNVRYRSLDAVEARAADLVLQGTTFGELCELLATEMPSDAVPPQAASFLKRWIEDQWLSKA
jgi:hypothetical protein